MNIHKVPGYIDGEKAFRLGAPGYGMYLSPFGINVKKEDNDNECTVTNDGVNISNNNLTGSVKSSSISCIQTFNDQFQICEMTCGGVVIGDSNDPSSFVRSSLLNDRLTLGNIEIIPDYVKFSKEFNNFKEQVHYQQSDDRAIYLLLIVVDGVKYAIPGFRIE